MSSNSEVAEEIYQSYEEAVSGLSVEDAIEVNEELSASLTAALLGLEEDARQ